MNPLPSAHGTSPLARLTTATAPDDPSCIAQLGLHTDTLDDSACLAPLLARAAACGWVQLRSPFDPSAHPPAWRAGICPAATTGWNGTMDAEGVASSPSRALAYALLAWKSLHPPSDAARAAEATP